MNMGFANIGYSKDIAINFIANGSVRITDGEQILFTDFPYVSGAYGQMTYTYPFFVEQDNDVTTLITHRLNDSFDPAAFMNLKWKIIAPSEVIGDLQARYKASNDARNEVIAVLEKDHEIAQALSPDSEVPLVLPAPVIKPNIIPFSSTIKNGAMTITPIKTAFAGAEHYSYLVQWSGRTIYFSGDTGDTDHLAALPELDIAFLTPWLHENARRANALPNAKKIVIYQHKDNEIIPNCTGCVIPIQGGYVSFD